MDQHRLRRTLDQPTVLAISSMRYRRLPNFRTPATTTQRRLSTVPAGQHALCPQSFTSFRGVSTFRTTSLESPLPAEPRVQLLTAGAPPRGLSGSGARGIRTAAEQHSWSAALSSYFGQAPYDATGDVRLKISARAARHLAHVLLVRQSLPHAVLAARLRGAGAADMRRAAARSWPPILLTSWRPARRSLSAVSSSPIEAATSSLRPGTGFACAETRYSRCGDGLATSLRPVHGSGSVRPSIRVARLPSSTYPARRFRRRAALRTSPTLPSQSPHRLPIPDLLNGAQTPVHGESAPRT